MNNEKMEKTKRHPSNAIKIISAIRKSSGTSGAMVVDVTAMGFEKMQWEQMSSEHGALTSRGFPLTS